MEWMKRGATDQLTFEMQQSSHISTYFDESLITPLCENLSYPGNEKMSLGKLKID